MDFYEGSQIIIQLFLAAFLGSLIGLEREFKRKEAGLQTYSLVTLGSCLFTVISFRLFNLFVFEVGISFDPSRIIQAIAVGSGFYFLSVVGTFLTLLIFAGLGLVEEKILKSK